MKRVKELGISSHLACQDLVKPEFLSGVIAALGSCCMVIVFPSHCVCSFFSFYLT